MSTPRSLLRPGRRAGDGMPCQALKLPCHGTQAYVTGMCAASSQAMMPPSCHASPSRSCPVGGEGQAAGCGVVAAAGTVPNPGSGDMDSVAEVREGRGR